MKPLVADFDWGGLGLTYNNLIESFEHEILARADEHDYQGDSLYLLRDGDRVGFLQFGWGSCSGCDALYACDTVAEATELRDRLFGNIHWFDSLAAALEYVATRDWEGEYVDEELVREFKAECAKLAPAFVGREG